ncbi:trehalose-phosphatase [Jatrophihabitans cynanchi]|uniref:Trehalose 6-phosphate phosphatase n=1 Tax=Jatrophihabitans cynanchi TaxID=2944128 RepID=A0ABY7JW83_9ACTN|nr:trehalose-phosphatase [Jatrophihabitans sp. SB3-54]WAX56817.1 trehalose-phosphatase [Jatrophihabitans sp. SB3-54]
MDLSELTAAVRADLSHALVALDFDGTLAPIVPDPADSRPVDGTVGALSALAGRGAQVAIITGRDAHTVLELSGLAVVPGLIVEGLYGAESWRDGELTSPPTPEAIEQLRQRLPGIVATGDKNVWIEDKRLSLVVHGRLARDPDAALAPLRAPVLALAAELGFEVHDGRGVIELRLPGFDKAGALRRLVDLVRPSSVLFAGDDVGDLPAFAAVRSMRSSGAAAYGVGVRSSEVPELADSADVLVDGPGGVLELLTALVG